MMKKISVQAPSSKLLFLRQFLSKPLGIGSITPSSKRVARLMVNNLGWQPDEYVIELGPGTGVFTRELLARGVPANRIVLIEFNSDFVKFLRREFPNVKVIEGDASTLPLLLEKLGIGKVKRIVSGIPMRSLSRAMGAAITSSIAASLEAGGVAVQFTYATMAPLAKDEAKAGGLMGQRADWALLNVPPAIIWRYVKSQ
jgi:phosphatidylethanolamine/phosphatidyl-N-methylethanolamine N-methyltransferase